MKIIHRKYMNLWIIYNSLNYPIFMGIIKKTKLMKLKYGVNILEPMNTKQINKNKFLFKIMSIKLDSNII